MDLDETEIVPSTNNSNTDSASAYEGFEDLFIGAIPSKNLKQFALTFQCMSKFGNEMTFEVTSNCLLLRVLNDAKTVFLTFRFGDAFFEKYQLINENEMNSTNINPVSTEGGRNLKFKALLKPFTSVLRSLRTVERLEIIFSENAQYSTLTFRMHCQRGILKTHIFQVERTDIYHVVFDRRNDGPNKFLIKPKTFLNILDQIHGAEEIVIHLDRSSARILSHHHNFDESSVSVASEVDIPITELENRIFNNCSNEGVELIVCLKEIKHFLSYCSAPEIVKQNLNAQIYFNQNGSPMLFSTRGAHRAEMILATVADIQNDNDDDEESEEDEMMMPYNNSRSSNNNNNNANTSSTGNKNKKNKTNVSRMSNSSNHNNTSYDTVSFYNNNNNNNNINSTSFKSNNNKTLEQSYNNNNKTNNNSSNSIIRNSNKNDRSVNNRKAYSRKRKKKYNDFDNGVDENEADITMRLFGRESQSQDGSPSKLDTTVIVDDDNDDDDDDDEEEDSHDDAEDDEEESEEIDINDKTVIIESMVPSSQ